MNLATAVRQAALDEGCDNETAWRIHDRYLAAILAENPNRQVFSAGLMLCENAAPLTSRAVAHIANIINGNDSYPGTHGDGSRSSNQTSATERAGLHTVEDGSDGERPHEVYLARARREDIRDLRHAIILMIRDYLSLLRKALPADEQHQAVLLCDGRGFEGSELAWIPHSRDEHNGWHDPTCVDGADDSKLCPKCKLRERRWREKRGMPPRAANTAQPAQVQAA